MKLLLETKSYIHRFESYRRSLLIDRYIIKFTECTEWWHKLNFNVHKIIHLMWSYAFSTYLILTEKNITEHKFYLTKANLEVHECAVHIPNENTIITDSTCHREMFAKHFSYHHESDQKTEAWFVLYHVHHIRMCFYHIAKTRLTSN